MLFQTNNSFKKDTSKYEWINTATKAFSICFSNSDFAF